MVTERMQFITRHLAGESIGGLSQEFGISLKTGKALLNHYEQQWTEGLRRLEASPKNTGNMMVERILALAKEHRKWAPEKLKTCLEDTSPGFDWRGASTISAMISEVQRIETRKQLGETNELLVADDFNEVWCVDFNGAFRLGNQRYCYPLTIVDEYSECLLGCEALEGTKADRVEEALWDVFQQRGIPDRIRTEKVAPFVSRGFGGLSRLSVSLMRLGIQLELTEPGAAKPAEWQTRLLSRLKAYAMRPTDHGFLAQQQTFDSFKSQINRERAVEVLGNEACSEWYIHTGKHLASANSEPKYPLHEHVAGVTTNGSFRLPKIGSVYLGLAFVGQKLGLREISTGTWVVSFMDSHLGFLDVETMKIFPLPKSVER